MSRFFSLVVLGFVFVTLHKVNWFPCLGVLMYSTFVNITIDNLFDHGVLRRRLALFCILFCFVSPASIIVGRVWCLSLLPCLRYYFLVVSLTFLILFIFVFDDIFHVYSLLRCVWCVFILNLYRLKDLFHLHLPPLG